jgi:cytochrome P450
LRALADAPFFDWFSPEVQADPEPVWAHLRARSAIARTPLGATVLRRDEVHRLFGDPRLVSAIPFLVRLQGVNEGWLQDMLGASVIALDGPDHTRLRRLVARAFTPRAADQHRPVMRALTDELVDRFAARGRCDFVTDFADHYPVQVICEVLGVPRRDHPLFARWGDVLTYILSLEVGAHLVEIEQAAGELAAYVDVLVEERRRTPGDDLVSSLVAASEDGDRLTPLELQVMISGLLFAGYDTTRNQLGHALVVFAHHPGQWALLAEQPDLASQAVNEVMRLAGAVTGVPRIAAEPIEVDGWEVPAGTMIFLSAASANRDEDAYDDALVFDITKERAPHMTFGGGPHYCLGANLARAEMEEALRILPRRLRNIRLESEPAWRMGTGISGPSTVPLAFDPA